MNELIKRKKRTQNAYDSSQLRPKKKRMKTKTTEINNQNNKKKKKRILGLIKNQFGR